MSKNSAINKNKKIGIAGAGGIGSNVAVDLVRCGFKNFFIVDFDLVEKSNLNRQFFFESQIGMPKVEALKNNLLNIYSDLNIDIFNGRVDRDNCNSLFMDCDIVIEGFDKKENKVIVIEQLLGTKELIVSSSGIGGDDINSIEVKEIYSDFFVVGDGYSDIDKYPTYSFKVKSVASLMAQVVFKKGGGIE